MSRESSSSSPSWNTPRLSISANRVPGTCPSDVPSPFARWASLAWRWSRRKRPDVPVLRTRKSRSSISISSDGRTSLPPSSKPKPSPSRRMCQPSSCRRASTSSRPRRSRRPTTILSSVARHVLAWCQRFDQAPDLDQVGPSLVALSYFNRGFVLLRAGRISRARQAFERVQQIYPVGPMLDGVTGLQSYDQHAREVARRVVRLTAERFPMEPVAA